MTTNNNEHRNASRRAFLKAGGVGALTVALAGCEEIDEGDGEPEAGTGTSKTGDGKAPNDHDPGTTVYAVDPAPVVEGRDGEVRSAFLDIRHSRVYSTVEGTEVTNHAVSYGHGADDALGPLSAQSNLTAGVLSTPSTVDGGENPLATEPVSELLETGAGVPLRRAIGLGSEVQWVDSPSEVAVRTIEALGTETQVREFVGFVANRSNGAQAQEAVQPPRITVATIYIFRTDVEGTAVVFGMADAWETLSLTTDEVDDQPTRREIAETASREAERAARGETVNDSAGALTDVGNDEDEEADIDIPPSAEEEYVQILLDSPPARLTPQGRRDLGYPTEDSGRLNNTNSYLTGRTHWSFGEQWDEDTFDRGTNYTLDIETVTRSYTVGGDETFPVTVVTAPLVERDGANRNPLNTEDLRDLLAGPGTDDGVLEDALTHLNLYDDSQELTWTAGPTELASSSVPSIGSAEVTVFKGTVTEVSNQNPDKDVDIFVARSTRSNNVDVTLLANASPAGTVDEAYWNRGETARKVFERAVREVEFGAGTLTEWDGLGLTDLRLVQTVANTRVEDPSGTVFAETPDPDLVAGRNTAPVFGLSSTGSLSAAKPVEAIVETDVENRSDRFRSILDGTVPPTESGPSEIEVLGDPSNAPAAVLDEIETDPPVFELATNHDSVTVSVRAPSGYEYQRQTLTKGPSVAFDYDVTTVNPLQVGFMAVTDPGDGANYGDSNGQAANYRRSVAVALAYLERVVPGPVYAYRHDDKLGGYRKNLGTGEFIDLSNAWTLLQLGALTNNQFPSNGVVWGIGGSDTAAENSISRSGFDICFLIVPKSYWIHHQNNKKLRGLAPASPQSAVGVLEMGPHSDRGCATTTAHEMGHHFVEQAYDQTTGRGDWPLAQRDDKGEDRDASGNNFGDVDLDHARHQDSNLDENSGTDEPGLISQAFDLTDGGYTHVKDFRVDPRSDADDGGTLTETDNDGTDLRGLESFMSYEDGEPVWTDAVIHQELIDSGWSGLSLSENLFSGVSRLEDDGTAFFVSMRALEQGKGLTEDVDDGTVLVEMVAPDGEVLASRRVADSVEAYDGADYEGVVSFQFAFPMETAALRVTHESESTTETTTNPIVGVLRDAVGRVPDDGYVEAPTNARGALNDMLDDVETAMGDGDYLAASDRLAEFGERASTRVKAEYDTLANQPTRTELLDLSERMNGRLQTLAEYSDDEETESPNSGWTTFQRDSANTGSVAEQTGPTANVDDRWRFETESSSSSSLTTDGSTVYFGDDSGSVYALGAADGALKWTTDVPGSVRSAPTLAGDQLYVATRAGTVHALAADTGETLWDVQTSEGIDTLPVATSSPTVLGDTVYVATPGGTMYALGSAVGDEQWSYALDGDCYVTPAVVEGTVYTADTDGGVYAIDAADGSTVWDAEATGGVHSTPTAANGQVYLGTQEGTLDAFDADDGSLDWTLETDVIYIISSPAVAGNRLYFGSVGVPGNFDIGHVHAVDTVEGTERWRVETDDKNLSSPAVTGDTVYAGSGDGGVYALGTAEGTEQWRFETGGDPPNFDDVDGSPAVVDETVFVVSNSSNRAAHVFAIEGDTP